MRDDRDNFTTHEATWLEGIGLVNVQDVILYTDDGKVLDVVPPGRVVTDAEGKTRVREPYERIALPPEWMWRAAPEDWQDA